jgi:hypothetical protein
MKASWFCIAAVSLGLVASAQDDNGFVAHEWGTFTSVQGADGVQMTWNPFIRTDLPGFVYDRARAGVPAWRISDYATKETMMTIVRMETPVIYFYSAKARTVDVKVKFPRGTITEWYPQATSLWPRFTSDPAERATASQSYIEWKGVNILPRDTAEITADKLIREKGENHYYEARATDANLLRVHSPSAKGAEYDRDLFYRGAGNFQAPLRLKLSAGDSLELSTTNGEPMTDLFVLTIRNGMARYQHIDHVSSTETRRVQLNEKSFAPLSDVREQIMREMATALVKQGLYEREADAMVNTWKHQWFAEDGVRVLYLLPRAWTDGALPLTMNPAPKQLARVMVGRAELITPQMELVLKTQVERYASGDKAVQSQAIAEVRKLGLGRFLQPATSRIVAGHMDKQFTNAAWAVARLASNGEVKAPTVVDKKPVLPIAEVRKTASLSRAALDEFIAF